MTRKKEFIQEAQNKQLLEELAKQPAMVVATAYLYAFNYINYGADVTKEWTTATQQSVLLAGAYNKGFHDGINAPNNATNGDMIKAVFGAEDIDEDFMMQTITVTMSDARKTFGRDWWYASYKKEGEQK